MSARGRGVPFEGALLVLSLCVLCACEARGSEHTPQGQGEPPATPESSRPVADQGGSPGAQVAATKAAPTSGRVVASSATLPARPERIISLAPNLTELLFSLGVERERVVGVTRFCDRPAAKVEQIEKIGGFVDPDMEKILSLRPDLIVGMKVGDAGLVEKLDRAGLPHVFFEMDTLEQTREAIEVVADVVDANTREREALLARFDAALARAPERAQGGPSTLFLVGREPLVLAGQGTFASELVARAGGEEATGKQGYVMIDMEYVLKLNPELIVDTSMPEEGDAFWGPYSGLRAVKSGAIYRVDPALIRPGPGLIDAHEALVNIYKMYHERGEGASR